MRPRPLLGAGERLRPEGGISEFGHGGGPETLFPSPTFFFGALRNVSKIVDRISAGSKD